MSAPMTYGDLVLVRLIEAGVVFVCAAVGVGIAIGIDRWRARRLR